LVQRPEEDGKRKGEETRVSSLSKKKRKEEDSTVRPAAQGKKKKNKRYVASMKGGRIPVRFIMVERRDE